MSTRLALLCLFLAGCDGFPILGPLFDEEPAPDTGSIVIRLPCHDAAGNTFPCPPPPPDSVGVEDRPLLR